MYSIVVSMFLAMPPQAPPVRGCPPQAPPVRDDPCTLCEGNCQCRTCNCPELEARLARPTAAPKVTPPVVKQAVTTQIVTTTRAAQGHTHTCPRCGTTWDHAANPGHNCPNCGTYQNVIDRVSRPVTIRKTVQIAENAPRQAPTQTMTLASLQTSAASSSGCANGQCSTVTSRGGMSRRR